MENEKIIELLFERDEKAVEILSGKYEKIYYKICSNILDDKEDQKECINDLYMKIWNNIPPNKPNCLLAYSIKIIRSISINRYKFNTAEKRNGRYNQCLDELEFCVSDSKNICDNIESNVLSKHIDDFVKSLNKTNRLLFVRRYWYLDDFETLSNLTNMSQGAVRTRLARIRNNLKKYLNGKDVLL